jgi:hypothetical protein
MRSSAAALIVVAVPTVSSQIDSNSNLSNYPTCQRSFTTGMSVAVVIALKFIYNNPFFASLDASLEPSSPMPAWRSPEGTKSGQKILQSYRAQKERAGLLRSPLQRIDHSSPLPPRLAGSLIFHE